MPFLAAITQPRWLAVLQECHHLSEVNFWRPSCRRLASQHLGCPFLFVEKGHSPRKVRGVGVISRFETLTIREAWARWGVRNGVTSLEEFVSSVAETLKTTKGNSGRITNTVSGPESRVGCIVVHNVVLLPKDVSPTVEQVLPGFSDRVVSFKSYQGAVPPPFASYIQVAAAEQGKNGLPLGEREVDELRAIEQHAVRICEAALGNYELLDVSTPEGAMKHLGVPHPGYDLLVRGSSVELHVEVKGTTASDPMPTLTLNEIQTALRDPQARLFVVSGIHTFRGNRGWEATGGVPRMYSWRIPASLRELSDRLDELTSHGLELTRAEWKVDVHKSDLLVVE